MLAPSPILSMRCMRALIQEFSAAVNASFTFFRATLSRLISLHRVVGRLCGVARHDGRLNLRFFSLEPSGLATVHGRQRLFQVLKLCVRVWCAHGDFNLVEEGGFDVGVFE